MVKVKLIKDSLSQILASSLHQNAIYFMLTTFATSFLGFFFWLIAARLLPESSIGLGAAVISAVNLLQIVGLFGLTFSIIRFLPAAEKPYEIMDTSLSFGSLSVIAASAIFILGLDFWSPALLPVREAPLFLLVFLILNFATTASTLFDSMLIARRKGGFYLLKNSLFCVLKVIILPLLVICSANLAIIGSWTAGLLASVVFTLFWFSYSRKGIYLPRFRLDLKIIKQLWNYSSLSYISFFLSRIPVLILPILIINLLGSEESAHFYIALMISNLLFTISESVSRSLFVESAHSRGEMRNKTIAAFKFTYLLMVPGMLGVLLFSVPVLSFYGEGYLREGLLLLWLMAVSSLANALIDIYGSILRASDRLIELIVMQGTISVLTLVASYFTLPALGIAAVGWAWLCVYGVMAAVIALKIRVFIKIPDNEPVY